MAAEDYLATDWWDDADSEVEFYCEEVDPKRDPKRICSAKNRYPKKSAADKAARRREKEIAHALDTYHCEICGGWHLTKSIGLKAGPPAQVFNLADLAKGL